MARPPPIHGLRVRGRVPGFSDGTSMCRRKTGSHPCEPSCGLSSTRPPRHRGPERAARSQRAEATTRAKQSIASSRALCFWRARCAPALPGPLGGGEPWTRRPCSGRCHGGQRLFARAGARSKSPATAHGLSVHGCTESAAAGWPSLWVTFLLATQEKSDSGAGRRTKPL